MSATLKPHPSVQRLNKAFVQVPASPQTLSSYQTFGIPSHVAASSKLKENTPLQPLQLGMNQQPFVSTSWKRKLSDRDPSSLIFDGVMISSKKSKLSSTANGTASNAKEIQPESLSKKAGLEFPNGFVYCHQCNKKRDASGKFGVHVVIPQKLTRINHRCYALYRCREIPDHEK
jgi:hypothetical protein